MFIRSVMNKGKNWGQEWVEMIVKSGAWNCWCALLTAFIPEFSEGSGGVQGGERSEEYACTGIMPSCGHPEYGGCLGKACLQFSLCCVLLLLTSLLPFFIQVALRSQFSGVNPVCSPPLPPTLLGALLRCPLPSTLC